MEKANLDWNNLGFSYIKTPFRYISYWRDGKWEEGTLTDNNQLTISEGSPALHYGQQCFEGLKAYQCADGSVNLFRPDENAKRLQKLCASTDATSASRNLCFCMPRSGESQPCLFTAIWNGWHVVSSPLYDWCRR